LPRRATWVTLVDTFMSETEKVVHELKSSRVTLSFGGHISDGMLSWKFAGDGLEPASEGANALRKFASVLVRTRKHIPIHKKKRMHVHIGGLRDGLSEIMVMEITPHGVVRNRFYKVRCDDSKIFRRMSSLAKIKRWSDFFKMVTALRHLV